MNPTLTAEQQKNETEAQAKRFGIEPTISAKELVQPVQPVQVSEPITPPPLPSNATVNAVRDESNNLIAAQTEEAKQLKDMRGQYAALADEGTLSDLFTAKQDEFGLPQNLKELKDINLQLADMQTGSDLTKVRIEGAAGQTVGQGQREVTQEDREAAVRSQGLAMRAAVLQGNIEAASALVNQAVNIAYQDRTLKNQNFINQINDLRGTVDEQTQQLLDKEERMYQEDQADIQRAKAMVDNGVTSGYITGTQLEELLGITDPIAQTEKAQQIIAQGIQREIAEAKAAAAASAAGDGTFDSPELKNFGTSDAPIWKQWNEEVGVWEDVSGIDGTLVQGEDPQKSLDQFSFLRDTVQRVIGNEELGYDPLYKASGKGVWDRTAGFFVGDTKYNRLDAQVDTLRTNMLTLMTDPNVKKFFGPQMSNADVKLMTAAGTTLRTESMSPEELKAEATRIDDLLNRMQTAVKNGVEGNKSNVVFGVPQNIITAPNGDLVEIIPDPD